VHDADLVSMPIWLMSGQPSHILRVYEWFEAAMDQYSGDGRQALMVRSSLIEEAKDRGVDIMQAAEPGVVRAVSRTADRETWRRVVAGEPACHAGLWPPCRGTLPGAGRPSAGLMDRPRRLEVWRVRRGRLVPVVAVRLRGL